MLVRHLIAFDTETTGFSPTSDQMIEIGAVKFIPDGTELDEFTMLISPGQPLKPAITELTGLTDMDLIGAPEPLEAVRAFLAWAGEGSLFLAHNAVFDMRFVYKAFLDHGAFVPDIPVIDTLPWVRSLRLPVKDHKLGTLLEHVGYSMGMSHRSLADARGLSILVNRLLHQHPDPLGALSPWLINPTLPKPETSFDVMPR
ncbi:MAG: hypothetical protein RLZZ303_3683 [Candidatus Hydrogenedentota bacterium]